MSLHFEKVTVKEIRKETADCVSIAFDIPETLREKFEYKAGQYLTLRAFIDGEEVRRSYSLCSSPLENEWRIAVKKVAGGVFSAYAMSELKAGDVIELMPPIGNFFSPLDADNKKQYIAFAAGSGITPIISLIKTTLIAEPQSSFMLVYGNRNVHSIIFKEELEGLKNKYMTRFSMVHVLSREMMDAAVNYGRIDAEKCELLFARFADVNADEFFICGPEEMIFCVKDFLKEKGVERRNIHVELFTSGKSEIRNQKSAIVEDGKVKSKVTIRLDGRSFELDLAMDGENILDAALHRGADLPYSCKGGVCCTCKAKLVEGSVDMEVHYGLERDEMERGFILTCQSHPRSERVVIDFDVK
jgi:ring-1,2-phenylacetyl-CoA epoxidase subunit PaaE